MICISPRLDEIADIWIRRIIKAIRLQLNCFSRREGGAVFFMCQERWAFRVKIQQVRACRSARVSLCQAVCGAVHHTSTPMI